MHQVECPGNVGVDDTPDLLKILIEKSIAESSAGISKQRINLPSISQSPVEFVDPIESSEIGLHSVDGHIEFAQFLRGAFDLGFVGGDQQVEAVLVTAAR